MSHQKLTILFSALFLFMLAWTVGSAPSTMHWSDPATDSVISECKVIRIL